MLKSLLQRFKSRFPSYVFTRIYTKRRWKGESASGAGSSLEQTRAVREALPGLLRELGAKSLLDIPCGDLHWIKEADLAGVQYIGADIVRPLIERNRRDFAGSGRRFEIVNLITDPLPDADAVLCRDCLVHLSHQDVLAALDNVRRSKASWFIATTYTGNRPNVDILTGQWRTLNLQLPPFNLPPPAHLVDEKCTEGDGQFTDKYLGVWRVADMR
jgi:SAM-dependent methyltransferase